MSDESEKTPKEAGNESPVEPAPTVRKGYEAAQEPERQGDGDPGPDTITQDPSEQADGSL